MSGGTQKLVAAVTNETGGTGSATGRRTRSGGPADFRCRSLGPGAVDAQTSEWQSRHKAAQSTPVELIATILTSL